MRSATCKISIQKSKVIESPLFQLASVTYLTIKNKRPVPCNSLHDIVVLLDPASFKLDPALHTLGNHRSFPLWGHSAFHYVKWTNARVLHQNYSVLVGHYPEQVELDSDQQLWATGYCLGQQQLGNSLDHRYFWGERFLFNQQHTEQRHNLGRLSCENSKRSQPCQHLFDKCTGYLIGKAKPSACAYVGVKSEARLQAQSNKYLKHVLSFRHEFKWHYRLVSWLRKWALL